MFGCSSSLVLTLACLICQKKNQRKQQELKKSFVLISHHSWKIIYKEEKRRGKNIKWKSKKKEIQTKHKFKLYVRQCNEQTIKQLTTIKV